MLRPLLRNTKYGLTRLGSSLSERSLHQLQMVVNYLRVGRWLKDNGFHFEQRYPTREEVYDAVARQVADREVLYCEFGVFEGYATRWWSRALRNPKARLHGFDSFEGLPDDYDDPGGKYVKGHFSTGGRTPDIDDPRVEWFVGWFDDTLPDYQVPDHEVLVLNLDADLYSSTKLVLDTLRPHITAGTFIYFDELSRPAHEPRAFTEFMAETGLRFRPVAADTTCNNAFFECLG